MSEATYSTYIYLISTDPQYDERLLIVHKNGKLRIPAEHFVYTNCCFCFVLTFRTMFSPCYAKIRASDKDLPVLSEFGSEREDLYRFWAS